MNGSRHDAAPPGSGRADEDGQWPASAAPHGYDRNEFGPGESRRDFPPRPRVADEERRLLKEAEAAFEGPDRRHDIDDKNHIDALDGEPHSTGAEGSGEAGRDRPSRLFRD